MDRLTEMEAFATVVDQGGFTDAARKLGMSKSAVSKHVSALEARLGARLLNRTTRRVAPTDIGLAYYDRARRVLHDAGDADALVIAMQSAPSGLLRLSVAADFGATLLAQILGQFLQDYPDITVNMVMNHRYVEMISDGFDMAIRVGALENKAPIGNQTLHVLGALINNGVVVVAEQLKLALVMRGQNGFYEMRHRVLPKIRRHIPNANFACGIR